MGTQWIQGSGIRRGMGGGKRHPRSRRGGRAGRRRPGVDRGDASKAAFADGAAGFEIRGVFHVDPHFGEVGEGRPQSSHPWRAIVSAAIYFPMLSRVCSVLLRDVAFVHGLGIDDAGRSRNPGGEMVADANGHGPGELRTLARVFLRIIESRGLLRILEG